MCRIGRQEGVSAVSLPLFPSCPTPAPAPIQTPPGCSHTCTPSTGASGLHPQASTALAQTALGPALRLQAFAQPPLLRYLPDGALWDFSPCQAPRPRSRPDAGA